MSEYFKRQMRFKTDVAIHTWRDENGINLYVVRDECQGRHLVYRSSTLSTMKRLSRLLNRATVYVRYDITAFNIKRNWSPEYEQFNKTYEHSCQGFFPTLEEYETAIDKGYTHQQIMAIFREEPWSMIVRRLELAGYEAVQE